MCLKLETIGSEKKFDTSQICDVTHAKAKTAWGICNESCKFKVLLRCIITAKLDKDMCL